MASDGNGLDDIARDLENMKFEPEQIRKRLPSTFNDESTRTLVCAIRNPNGRIDQIAATAGVEERTVYESHRLLAERNEFPVMDLSDDRMSALDILIEDGGDADAIRKAHDNIETFASRVGKRAGSAANPTYVENFIRRDDIGTLVNRRRIDLNIRREKRPISTVIELIDSMGIARYLHAVGIEHPGMNMDEPLEEPIEPPKKSDYVVVKFDEWDEGDLEPEVEYYAKVNQVKPYGVFVTLAGSDPKTDIAGLVHRSDLPPLTSPMDFEVGDEVAVRLVERRPNGDIGFELAAIIDALRYDPQEFEARTEYVDRRPGEGTTPARAPEQAEPPADDDIEGEGN